MSASHSGHGVQVASGNRHALIWSAWLTGIYFVIELGIGLYTGSVAVMSDAFHTFSAAGGVVLALIAAGIAARPADAVRTFGAYRAEIIGALMNGAFLLIMAIVVIVMGAMRLMDPVDLPTTPMLFAAVGGIVTEVISLWLLYGGQKGDLNIRGAFWHVVQTFVGSILIVVTALVIKFTGFLQIDPLLGIAFGFVLLFASWGIIEDALVILMESAPEQVDMKSVHLALLALDGVSNVHHIHAWTLTSKKYVFSAHVSIEEAENAAVVLKKAHALLRNRFGFFLSTIQIEAECMDEDHAQAIDVSGIL